jgi:hypothetical protein
MQEATGLGLRIAFFSPPFYALTMAWRQEKKRMFDTENDLKTNFQGNSSAFYSTAAVVFFLNSSHDQSLK